MTAPPTAEVVSVRGTRVTVRCPYCGGTHVHGLNAPGTTERHAPGCGMYRSPAQRAAGYRITTTGRHNDD